MGNIHFKYIFKGVNSNDETTVEIILDAQTLDIINISPSAPADWTRLKQHQCPQCKLDPNTSTYCPLAIKLAEINTLFSRFLSHDEIQLTVITQERNIIKMTNAQHAISSLMGLIIPCSGCPDTRFFKPMARFHLPLSTEEETIYRVTSMYLLYQYYNYKNGKTPDLDLTELNNIYSTMHEINTYCAKRLRQASTTDSAVNAVILLDMFTKNMPFAIDESLAELKYLFNI